MGAVVRAARARETRAARGLTAELGVVQAAMEQERNNQRNAQEDLEVRCVCGQCPAHCE